MRCTLHQHPQAHNYAYVQGQRHVDSPQARTCHVRATPTQPAYGGGVPETEGEPQQSAECSSALLESPHTHLAPSRVGAPTAVEVAS